MNKAIYFKGINCSVCQALLPKVETHFNTVYPLLQFEVIPVEEQPEIAGEYGVFTIPVLIVILEGKEYYRFVRHFSPAQIDEKLQRTYCLLFQE